MSYLASDGTGASSGASGVHYDPRFPDRPQTQDFARLSEAVTANDSAVEGGRAIEEVLDIDVDSLTYLAKNRLGMYEQARGRGRFGTGMTQADREMMMGLYIDAFAAGQAFERRGGHRE